MLVQIVAPTGEIIYANNRWKHALGYSDTDLVNLSLLDLLADPDPQSALELLKVRPSDGQIETMLTLRAKDGRHIRLQGTLSWQMEGSRVACVHGFFQHAVDASERSEVPEPAHRLMLDTSSEIIATTDTEGLLTSLSPAFESITGWPRKEWISKSIHQLSCSEDKVSLTDTFFRLLKGATIAPMEIQIVSNGQGLVPVVVMIRPVHSGAALTGTSVRLTDLRKTRSLEQRLAQSESRFQAVLETAFQAIVIHENFSILKANSFFSSLVGTQAPVNGRSLREFLIPEENRTIPMEPTPHRIALRTNSGRKIPVELSSALIPHATSEVWLSAIHPVATEDKSTS